MVALAIPKVHPVCARSVQGVAAGTWCFQTRRIKVRTGRRLCPCSLRTYAITLENVIGARTLRLGSSGARRCIAASAHYEARRGDSRASRSVPAVPIVQRYAISLKNVLRACTRRFVATCTPSDGEGGCYVRQIDGVAGRIAVIVDCISRRPGADGSEIGGRSAPTEVVDGRAARREPVGHRVVHPRRGMVQPTRIKLSPCRIGSNNSAHMRSGRSLETDLKPNTELGGILNTNIKVIENIDKILGWKPDDLNEPKTNTTPMANATRRTTARRAAVSTRRRTAAVGQNQRGRD